MALVPKMLQAAQEEERRQQIHSLASVARRNECYKTIIFNIAKLKL